MKAVILMTFVCLAICAVNATEDAPKPNCDPGPCELKVEVSEGGHALGDFTPEGPLPDTPAELVELYEKNNITTTAKPSD